MVRIAHMHEDALVLLIPGIHCCPIDDHVSFDVRVPRRFDVNVA